MNVSNKSCCGGRSLSGQRTSPVNFSKRRLVVAEVLAERSAEIHLLQHDPVQQRNGGSWDGARKSQKPITPTESVSTPAASTPVDFEHLLKPASRPSPQQHSLTNAPALNGVAGTTDRLPDIVWGPGKSADQIAAALVHLTITQRLALAVRIEPEMYAAVRKHAPGVEYNARSHTLLLRSPQADTLPKQERLPGSICVVSGGTADLAVAEECKVTAEHLGCYCFRITDVSVSELGKLLQNLDALRAADALVVVCGTDAALPSVLAGLVDVPVIAVPTSAGFGASLGGIAPLLASLTSSAPGVTVANIDHGYGAAQTVTRMLRMASRLHLARREAERKAAATAAVLVAFAEESAAMQRMMEETVKVQVT